MIREQVLDQLRFWSLKEVATAAGIAPTTLSEWSRGLRNRRLGDRQLDAMAAAMGCQWTLTCKGEQDVPDDDQSSAAGSDSAAG